MLKAGRQALTVNNPEAARLKHTYVLFTGKSADDFMKPITEGIAARVRQAGWNYREMPFEHFPLLDKPHGVADLLLELA